MHIMRTTFLLTVLIALTATVASADKYVIDPEASQVAFRIRHAVGFNSGFIRKFKGEVDVRKYELKDLELTTDMQSITTFNETRDPIIKSADFFNVAEYPEAEIKSRKIEDGYLTAVVTIKDIKQEVTFYYQFLGTTKNDRGEEAVVITLQGALNKKDFDLNYSSLTLEGNENIGDKLELLIKLEGVKR
ncbi:MAG: YceI family protein [Candidatus Omnitrophica bacterium]|nr:YceI family protein [Candidatus Omnitrophota bacterium]